MKLETRIWKDLDAFKTEEPFLIIEGVEAYTRVVGNSIAIGYDGGEIVLPNTYIVDTVQIK